MVQQQVSSLVTPLATPRSWLLVLAHALVFALAYWLAFCFGFGIARPG